MPAALAFSWGTVRALAAMRPRRMRFRTDSGEAFSGEFVEVCLANGRFFGGGLGIAPTALLDDGLLNLVMIRGASSRVFLRFLPALRRAKPIHDARIEYRCCRSVEIEALPQDTCLVADGELLDSVPCVIDVVPRALRWLCD
jgi:diacylglycerol kinase family enzyme